MRDLVARRRTEPRHAAAERRREEEAIKKAGRADRARLTEAAIMYARQDLEGYVPKWFTEEFNRKADRQDAGFLHQEARRWIGEQSDAGELNLAEQYISNVLAVTDDYRNEQWNDWVRQYIERLSSEAIPSDVRNYVTELLRTFQRVVRKRPRRGRGNPKLEARNRLVARAVEVTAHAFDLGTSRNQAERDKEAAGDDCRQSACSIVQKALTRLGLALEERNVEEMYVAGRGGKTSLWDSWEKEAIHIAKLAPRGWAKTVRVRE